MADATYSMTPSGLLFDVAFGAAETTKTIEFTPGAFPNNTCPVIYQGFCKIPNWTNSVTLDVLFQDATETTMTWGNEDTALTKNGTRTLVFPSNGIPIQRATNLVLTLNGAPGGTGGTVTLALVCKGNAGGGNVSIGGDVVLDADINVAQFGGVAVQMDDTDKPAFSMYGKATGGASGDTPPLLETDGKNMASLYAYNAAAGDTALTAQATGEQNINLGMIAGVAPQVDDTDKLGVSVYGKNAAAGDTEVAVESGGETKTSLYAYNAAAADVAVIADAAGQLQIDVQKIDGADPQLDNTNKLGVSLYAKSVAAGDKEVLVDSDGHVQVDVLSTTGTGDVNVAQFGGVNVQLDDTDKPAMSIYGKSVASGDTEINVETGGETKVSLYAYNAAAADTALTAQATGEQNVNTAMIAGVAPTMDNTSYLGISLHAKNVAAGDVAVQADAAGQIQIDVQKIDGQDPQMDSTNRIGVSLYGKNAAAGDTEVHVDAAGDVQVDVLSDATAATRDGYLATLAGAVSGSELQVDIVADATAATRDGHLATIAGAVSGSEMQIDIVSTALLSPITTTQAIIDLPTNAQNPSEIDCSASSVHYIECYSEVEFQYCFAADQATANTNIGADTTRGKYPAGTGTICVSGDTTNKFYVRANDASGLVDGFSYHFRGA